MHAYKSFSGIFFHYSDHDDDDDDVSHCKMVGRMTCFKAAKTASPWLINVYIHFWVYFISKLNIYKNFDCLYHHSNNEKYCNFLLSTGIIIVSWKHYFVLLKRVPNAHSNHDHAQYDRQTYFGEYIFWFLNFYECERDDSMHENNVSKFELFDDVINSVHSPVTVKKHFMASVYMFVCLYTHCVHIRWWCECICIY